MLTRRGFNLLSIFAPFAGASSGVMQEVARNPPPPIPTTLGATPMPPGLSVLHKMIAKRERQRARAERMYSIAAHPPPEVACMRSWSPAFKAQVLHARYYELPESGILAFARRNKLLEYLPYPLREMMED